jgi:hypothetical protein
MNLTNKWAPLLLAAGLASASCGTALGQSLRSVDQTLRDASFEERFSGTRLNFNVESSLSNFTLRVTGPDGYHGQVFSARSAPSYRLGDYGTVADGLYYYEMTAATTQTARMATPPVAGANGRSGQARPGTIGTATSGSFRVANGQILILDSSASER